MKTSTFARNTQLDRLAALATSGYLRIYSAPMADSPDGPVPREAQMISEHRLGNPAFRSAFNATIKANAITDDPDARVTAVAAWFRVTQSNGASVLWDGTCGVTGADLNFRETAELKQHGRVSIGELTITQP